MDEIRMNLWERYISGEISDEEWGGLMWANGYMPDDYYADDDEDSGYYNEPFDSDLYDCEG